MARRCPVEATGRRRCVVILPFSQLLTDDGNPQNVPCLPLTINKAPRSTPVLSTNTKLAKNGLGVPEADFWPRIAALIACDSVHNCHGDRAALIYAFVPDPMGQSKMAAVSRPADFSFDRYL